MDNISKVLAVVLGIAGLLALLTPSEVPFAPKLEKTGSSPHASSEDPIDNAGAPEPQQIVQELPSEIVDTDVKFGEPTIDGNPILDVNGSTQQSADETSNSSEQQQQPLTAQVPGTYQGYKMPQPYGSQAPEIQTDGSTVANN